jgi:molybdopterin molybdotransferase
VAKSTVKKTIQLCYLNFEESIKRLLDSIKLKARVKLIQTLDSVGEILAEDIKARFDVPAFNIAFYDGYALRSEDVKNASGEKPVKVKIIGKMLPDDNPSKLSLKAYEAAYVSSGAPLPLGADTVVRFENVKIDREYAFVTEPSEPWDRVILQGEDVKRDEIIFKRGHVIRPQDVGLLLQAGYSRVKVFRKPRIGVLSVGDELLSKFNDDRLSYPDNFHAIVKSFFELFKFNVEYLGIVPDDVNEIKKGVENSCLHYDALLLISGASTGDNDLVHAALQEIGNIIFHGVRISPGKVTGAALVKDCLVFMVPGHVGSLYVCLSLYVAPALFKALGVNGPLLRIKAKAASEILGRPGMSVVKAVQLIDAQGDYLAKVVEKRLGGSGLLTSLTEANGLILLPPNAIIKPGEEVLVYLFNPYEVFHIHTL